jgi:type II restriction enzyme
MPSTPLPDLPNLLPALIDRYKTDPESVYNTWFIGGEERMKAFGAIRRGVRDTVEAIAAGTFGNDFRGSPLETVLMAITEQKQVFEGAAHPFYWKPKLRIPDIYENEPNKQKFGFFLHACANATREEQILDEISRLAAGNIKGLGPAVASIVYFLHPTLIPPFNTAIINGFNALFGTRLKLGSWPSYLSMREAIMQANLAYRNALSKDLGAFAGLLFEIGNGRLITPDNADTALQTLQANADKLAQRRHQQVIEQQREESEHTQVQHMLIRIGRALNYKVYVARNDRHRSCHGEAFALLTTEKLPNFGATAEVASTVGLIDVIWLNADTTQIVCAFEIEKSTSIYSGILRMKDLARSLPHQNCHFYLVAPAKRKQEVMAQMSRPALRDTDTGFPLGYIPFELLKEHCDALCRFGDDLSILKKIADFGVTQAAPADMAESLR